ncbi:hypothetical protein K0M31_006520 [Melipona bicolor]|uniref:Uncharacterized protein n=1 Tax=Melipona bicolor TaxID=60889 RepID=A0AA40FTP8_9HYME|nr:hypothetical protein K0M31_006520 [Melipona bicolor]
MDVDSWKGKEAMFEIERTIERDISCYQKVLINLEEEVNQTQREIDILCNRHLDMSSKLEYGFREYCKRKAFLLHYTDKLMNILLIPAKESSDIIRHKFDKFQRKMLRGTEETERTKKVRLDNKRMCTSANL